MGVLKVGLVGLVIFALAFIALWSSANSEPKWFKAVISVIFSFIVSVLVTSNLFI